MELARKMINGSQVAAYRPSVEMYLSFNLHGAKARRLFSLYCNSPDTRKTHFILATLTSNRHGANAVTRKPCAA